MAKTRRHKNSKHLVKSRRGNKSRVNRKTKVRRRKRLSKRRGGGGRLRAMVTRMRPRSGVSKKKPKPRARVMSMSAPASAPASVRAMPAPVRAMTAKKVKAVSAPAPVKAMSAPAPAPEPDVWEDPSGVKHTTTWGDRYGIMSLLTFETAGITYDAKYLNIVLCCRPPYNKDAELTDAWNKCCGYADVGTHLRNPKEKMEKIK